MPKPETIADPSTLDLDDVPDLAIPAALWTIHDVARFLRRSENCARAYIDAWDDAPEPLFSDGRGRVWDPREWWAWAKTHNEAKAKRTAGRRRQPADVGKAKGTRTRV